MSAATMLHRGLSWPSTLRSRISIILLVGLAIAYGLSFSVLYIERYMSAKAIMLGTLESDVATSIAVLDRLPANERAGFVDWLSRGNYNFELGPGLPGVPDTSVRSAEIAAKIEHLSWRGPRHQLARRFSSLSSAWCSSDFMYV